jgi:hypothetical protein
MRRFAVAVVLGGLLALPGGVAAQAADTSRTRWDVDVEAYQYIDSDPSYLLPMATFDRATLHLEARYNYEDFNTASAWIGRNFGFGSAVAFTVTPMVGAVVGATNGIAPGLEVDISWKGFEFWSESEYVFAFEDPDEQDFYYNWSQLFWRAPVGLVAGVSFQRLKNVGTDLALDRGPVLGWDIGKAELLAYWFNPFSQDGYVVLGATYSLSF